MITFMTGLTLHSWHLETLRDTAWHCTWSAETGVQFINIVIKQYLVSTWGLLFSNTCDRRIKSVFSNKKPLLYLFKLSLCIWLAHVFLCWRGYFTNLSLKECSYLKQCLMCSLYPGLSLVDTGRHIQATQAAPAPGGGSQAVLSSHGGCQEN